MLKNCVKYANQMDVCVQCVSIYFSICLASQIEPHCEIQSFCEEKNWIKLCKNSFYIKSVYIICILLKKKNAFGWQMCKKKLACRTKISCTTPDQFHPFSIAKTNKSPGTHRLYRWLNLLNCCSNRILIESI